MPNPWDRPPLPAAFDADRELTYAGVGRVMSEWEGIEVTLSHLYSNFIDKRFQAEAMQEYGAGWNVKKRIEILETAAYSFLHGQIREADFAGLVEEIRGYAARRNEIAHGIVRPLEWFSESHEWWLVKAHYKPRKSDRAELPEYAYTRPLMDDIADKMLNLNHRISTLMSNLFPPRIEWN